MRGLTRTAPPASEPVSLADAKAHLRVDTSQDDTLIQGLIAAARQSAEEHLRRALVTQNWRLTLDRFPRGAGEIELPRPPLVSVSAVTVYDVADTASPVPAADYIVDATRAPGRILPRVGRPWPVVGRAAAGVEIDYVAGYGAASAVPEAIRQGILMLLAHFHERREATIADGRIAPIPFGVTALWRPYRVLGL